MLDAALPPSLQKEDATLFKADLGMALEVYFYHRQSRVQFSIFLSESMAMDMHTWLNVQFGC